MYNCLIPCARRSSIINGYDRLQKTYLSSGSTFGRLMSISVLLMMSISRQVLIRREVLAPMAPRQWSVSHLRCVFIACEMSALGSSISMPMFRTTVMALQNNCEWELQNVCGLIEARRGGRMFQCELNNLYTNELKPNGFIAKLKI